MIEVSRMRPDDWNSVRAIYLDGIRTGDATFEQSAPEWDVWDHGHLRTCRLVAHEGEKILGWAALSPVSPRAVYAGVAEVSIYVAECARGRGVGTILMGALVEESERNGIWTLQGSIFPENHASLELHEKHGFRRVGIRERIGCMNGCWRDTVLVERRSKR